jgi:hypothetical protein
VSHPGSRTGLALLLAAALVGSCAEAPHGFLAGVAAPPPEIQQACDLATAKCARCHPIERVTVYRGIGPARWGMYVEQMRLKPSSAITPSDAEIIFHCLQFVELQCTDCKQGRS